MNKKYEPKTELPLIITPTYKPSPVLRLSTVPVNKKLCIIISSFGYKPPPIVK